MLDKDDPAKGGHHEKDQPEHQTKVAHPPTVRVRGFHRKRVKLGGHPKTPTSFFLKKASSDRQDRFPRPFQSQRKGCYFAGRTLH
jgi:hypothetical protein